MKRIFLGLFVALAWNPGLNAQTPFYQGKTITLVAGASVVLASGEFGRPYLLPPGIPGERLKVLRDAFMKLMIDPAFLAEGKKRGLEVEPSTGEDLEQLAKDVMAQPPEIIERVKKLMGK
jgi:tripartite-type tricarboxylate transporter receptor subunit TctC